jgi:hypothetical protein
MTYACPAWDTYLLKLQRMQNKVLRTIGNFPRRTLVQGFNTAFNLPYVYDYITKLCRRQAEVIMWRIYAMRELLGRGGLWERRLRNNKESGIFSVPCCAVPNRAASRLLPGRASVNMLGLCNSQNVDHVTCIFRPLFLGYISESEF